MSTLDMFRGGQGIDQRTPVCSSMRNMAFCNIGIILVSLTYLCSGFVVINVPARGGQGKQGHIYVFYSGDNTILVGSTVLPINTIIDCKIHAVVPP